MRGGRVQSLTGKDPSCLAVQPKKKKANRIKTIGSSVAYGQLRTAPCPLDWIGRGKRRSSVGQCHEGTVKAAGCLDVSVMMPPPWEIPETQMGMSSVMFGHSRGKHGPNVLLSIFILLLNTWVGVGSQLHHDASGESTSVRDLLLCSVGTR